MQTLLYVGVDVHKESKTPGGCERKGGCAILEGASAFLRALPPLTPKGDSQRGLPKGNSSYVLPVSWPVSSGRLAG